MFIEHINLNTGHICRESRDSFDSETVATLAPMVAELRAGRRAALPQEFGGYEMDGQNKGVNCVIWTLWRGENRIATLGLATKSRCSAGVWRTLHDIDAQDKVVTDRNSPPATPWAAVRIHAGATPHPDWLDGFERRLAWAWMEG